MEAAAGEQPSHCIASPTVIQLAVSVYDGDSAIGTKLPEKYPACTTNVRIVKAKNKNTRTKDWENVPHISTWNL